MKTGVEIFNSNSGAGIGVEQFWVGVGVELNFWGGVGIGVGVEPFWVGVELNFWSWTQPWLYEILIFLWVGEFTSKGGIQQYS